jgi:HSP90 family molecular chaperone
MKRIASSSRLLLKNNSITNTISKSLSSSSLLLRRKLSPSSLSSLSSLPSSSLSLSSLLPSPSIVVSSNSLYSKRAYSINNKNFNNNDDVREFQAETRKLLDIVTHSIYTDREVFVRELISNASDALEKFRYRQVKGEVNANDEPLEINILANKDTNTLTLIDNGIGMSKEELIENLGTIARSGSKQFVESLKSTGSTDTNSIIGQFGVGFYSSFMVSDSVTVESISALKSADTNSNTWESDGSGTYKIKESSRSDNIKSRGSCIVMKLKESCKEFADADKIKSIIQRYSNFVAFPIKVNGEVVNTVSAIWLNDKNSVTTEQYNNFYKFIANAFDEPRYTLHFRADAPIDLKCLFYVPTFHTEKFGMGRMEPGVNLYSRKVLIESKPKDLLPDWLRFIKGVVDSEDLPLSLSREKPQDSNLLRRIREVLTRKLIRYLEEQMKNDAAKYKEFYIEFNYFLKEGICHDFRFMDQISKLLLFESSSLNEGELTSFDEYIARSTPDEKEIYYLVAPNR